MGSTRRFESSPRALGQNPAFRRRHAAGGLKIPGCFSAFKNDLVAGFVEIDLKDLLLTYFFSPVVLFLLIIVLRLFFVQGAAESASFYSSHEQKGLKGLKFLPFIQLFH